MSTLRANEIVMLDGIGKATATFDSVQDMKDSAYLRTGQKARTLGYYAPGDGGSNDYEIVEAGTGTDDAGSFIDLASSGVQAKGLFLKRVVDPRQFGAKVGSANDSTLSLQNADAYAASTGMVLSLVEGDYFSSPLSIASNVNMEGTSRIVANFTGEGTLVTLTSSNTNHGKINLTGNSDAVRKLLQVNGSNIKIDSVSCGDVNVGDYGAGFPSVINIVGDNCYIRSCTVTNVVNSGYPNGSAPQALANSGSGTVVNEFIGSNIVSGIVLSSPTNSVRVDSMIVRGVYDNGIYHLDGYLEAGTITYEGDEEAVVLRSDAVIGSIFCSGSGLTGVSFQPDVGTKIHVGTISVHGDYLYWFRTRETSLGGHVKIDRLVGDKTGATIFAAVDPLESLSIGSADLTLRYQGTGTLNFFCSIIGVEEFNFGRIFVKIVDETDSLTSTDYFLFRPKNPISRVSTIDSFDVTLTLSDEVTVSPAIFRGRDLAQGKIFVRNGKWRTTIGPYLRETTYVGALGNGVNVTPTTGFWKQGQDFLLLTATSAPFRTRCVESGEPGTWVEY